MSSRDERLDFMEAMPRRPSTQANALPLPSRFMKLNCGQVSHVMRRSICFDSSPSRLKAYPPEMTLQDEGRWSFKNWA